MEGIGSVLALYAVMLAVGLVWAAGFFWWLRHRPPLFPPPWFDLPPEDVEFKLWWESARGAVPPARFDAEGKVRGGHEFQSR